MSATGVNMVEIEHAASAIELVGGTGISWRKIEVLTGYDGRPSVKLSGQPLNKAAELNLKEVSVSLSDSKQNAIGVAIGI